MPVLFLLLSFRNAEAGTDIKLYNGQLIHADKYEIEYEIEGNYVTYTLPERDDVYKITLDEVESISGKRIKHLPAHERRHKSNNFEPQLFIIPFRRFGIIELGMNMNEVRSILGEPDNEERMVTPDDIDDFWDYDHTHFHFANGILRNWIELK